MKKLFTLISIVSASLLVNAQSNYQYYISNAARFLNAAGTDTLQNAFAGGMHAPQFCEMDLNGDNVMDLMIFDRAGNKITTFINNGTANTVDYIYAPQYEDKFPKLEHWVITRDYNRDGKMDIFTSAKGRNLYIYKNTSTGGDLSFEIYINSYTQNIIRADRPGTAPTFDSVSIFVFDKNFPAIDDIDGDGDLDILSFPVFGDAVDLYLNRQEDANLSKDSVAFSHVDLCWGSFGENLAGGINLGFCTWGNPNSVRYYKKRHNSGGALTLFDADGDGDMDLFHGTLDIAGVKYLKNGKEEFNSNYDTIISYSDDFPAGQKKVDLYHFVNTFFIDMDNDNLKDMVVTVNGISGVQEVDQVWWYKNTGTNLIPDFKFQSEDIIQNTMVDLGGRTCPTFWDYDGDGDLDLIIASNGDYSITFNQSDRLYFYENVGTKKKAIYKLLDDDFLGLSADNIGYMSPTIGDIDDDGKADLLIGTLDGTIRHYKNTTTGSTPTFSLQTTSLQGIDVGSNAAPYVVDLDKDSRFDLIVGTKGGNIHYYRNTGSNASPAYQLITDTLGNVKINEYLANVSPPVYVDSAFSVPVITDVDGDGKYELIAGGLEGKIKIYNNIDGNLTGTFDEVDSILYNTTLDSFVGSIKMGKMVYPTVGDINDDNMMDILIGNSRGGLTLWSSKRDPISVPRVKELASHNLKVYPNPAGEHITISRDRNDISLNVQVINTLGQVMFTDTIKKGEYKKGLDVSNLQPGVYFVNISTDDGETQTIKFAVFR